MMLITTPIGVAAGIYEGYHLAGPVMTIAVVMIVLFSAGMLWTVMRARRESQTVSKNPPR